MVDENEKERIRLAEADLARTNEFIKGVIATGAALRGSSVTIWLALLGFAFQQKLSQLGFLAAIVAAIFAILDGYHGWLYREASGHAVRTERLVTGYYDMLSRSGDDPDVAVRFRGQLRAHRIGLFTGFQTHFSFRQLWQARPAVVYRVLYPALFAIALLCGLLLQLNLIGKPGTPRPTHVVIENAPGRIDPAPTTNRSPLGLPRFD
ncbi:hypothetical protein, partial [Paractinoplanes toevensis]|uniref:hypothetical protein n=1 Tax=Paractinoplanes toevensis TaxID=571911 RepID=UPI001BB3E8E5